MVPNYRTNLKNTIFTTTKKEKLKALLFINGTPPNHLPEFRNYCCVACSDGAFHYLEQMDFPMERLDFISGDFDSAKEQEQIADIAQHHDVEIIETPDQDRTDFEKALKILYEKGISKIDVYGGSGGEMDHFLGNITAAYKFKTRLEIHFIDENSEFYFIPQKYEISNVKGRMISLYPFPLAENVITKGLNWPLNKENLNITAHISIRNYAIENTVNVEFTNGDILFFLGKKYF